MKRAPTSMPARGFTLVEMVVALVLAAIITGFVAMMTTAPVNAYLEQSGRSVLNDTADVAARSLETDLAHAVPNSVSWRNSGSRSIIEMLVYDEVVFYRAATELTPPDPYRDLTFGTSDDWFSTYGRLDGTAGGPILGRLIIGNLGRSANVPANRNIYRQPLPTPGIIFPSNRTMTITNVAGNPNEQRVHLSSGFAFVDPSTPATTVPSYRARQIRNRIFLLDEAVTYICNSGTRTLRRYSGYSTRATIPTSETAAQLTAVGVTDTLIADNVSSCLVRCWSGDTNVCQGALSLQIEFNRPSVNGGNDRLRLHKQFPMDNDL